MASKGARTKGGAEEISKQPQGARQAAKGSKGTRGARKASGRQKAPGRVVALGLDVPTTSEVAAEAEAAKQVEAETMGGPGAGRPEDYHPRFAEIARAMCRLGATDFDLAQEFGVRTQTIWNWRCKHPEFFDATQEGKEAFDNRAERSLAQRAVGYSYHSEKVFQYEGRIVRAQIVEHVPPDVGALRLWLMNRRPNSWRDKQELKLDSSDAFLKLWTAISDGSIEKMLGN